MAFDTNQYNPRAAGTCLLIRRALGGQRLVCVGGSRRLMAALRIADEVKVQCADTHEQLIVRQVQGELVAFPANTLPNLSGTMVVRAAAASSGDAVPALAGHQLVAPVPVDGFAEAKLTGPERFFMTNPEQIRDNLKTVDAIWKLEGFEPTADVTKYDEAIISGAMTTQEAVDRVIAEVKGDGKPPSPAAK